jgi:hypothetical protein
MNKSLTKILADDNALSEYILNLEKDIDNTEELDAKVDIILNNILDNFDYFKDRRALKASNFDAISNLIRLKSELPQKRIQVKKQLLDILTKKEELAIKRQEANAISANAGSSSNNILNFIFNNFDNNGIHPILPNEEVLTNECDSILDKTTEVDTKVDTKNSENKENNIDKKDSNIVSDTTDGVKNNNISKVNNILEMQKIIDSDDNSIHEE